MSLRSVTEEFVTFLRSMGVTGQKRIELDDTLRLQGVLSDYRHFRPRLNAQVVMTEITISSPPGQYPLATIVADSALGIWPLYIDWGGGDDLFIAPGGVIATWDAGGGGGSSQTPVGSKGLVSQSLIRERTSATAPGGNPGVMPLNPFGSPGGQARRFSFQDAFGEWVYQPESSEFAPSMMHFILDQVSVTKDLSIAWLEVRS